MHSVTEPRTLDELSAARKKLIGELKTGKTGLGKALKFLGKNKKFAIPGAALAAGAGALGLHNLID
jgi:hypothetical protein